MRGWVVSVTHAQPLGVKCSCQRTDPQDEVSCGWAMSVAGRSLRSMLSHSVWSPLFTSRPSGWGRLWAVSVVEGSLIPVLSHSV